MCISRFLAGVALLWLAESFAAEPKPTPVDQFCDPLPPGALARMGTVRWRHLDEGAMSGVRATLSPDGRLVATWNTAQSGTATVRVWTLADGKPVCEFPWDDATYRNDFRFTPDSKRLLTIRMNGAVRSHDAKTGQVLADTKPLFDPAGYPYGELLGGRWLLMHLKEPVLYELAADDQPKPVPLEKPEVGWDQLRWSAARPHGDTLVVVTRNNARAVGTTYVADRWDTRTGKLTGTAQLREKASGMMSVMSENGERFAAWKINPTEVNDTLLVWDTASGKLLA